MERSRPVGSLKRRNANDRAIRTELRGTAEDRGYWDLLTGFSGIIEFVVAFDFETQLHGSPGWPHWIGPLHSPDISSFLQSGTPEQLHMPPEQFRSAAKADVTTKGNNREIAITNFCMRRMGVTRSNEASLVQVTTDVHKITSAPWVDRVLP